MIACFKIHNYLVQQRFLSWTERSFRLNDLHTDIIIGVINNARLDKPGDTALDGCLLLSGIFQLVTDGDAKTGTDKLRQIGVKSMMWETGHGTLISIIIRSIAVTPSKRYTQYLRSRLGILLVSFIEVATTE